MGGTQPWEITSEIIFEGIYSARSGIIGNEQTSEISIEMNVATNDSISFYRKVSCEDDPYNNNWDWLGFFIDEVEMERWDGEYDWQKAAYPVTAGVHTLKWIYYKDYSVSSGQDAAWIDNIIFPAVAPFVAVEDTPGKQSLEFYILPNPARNKTELFVNIDANSSVSVMIYNLTGNQIKEAFSEQMMQPGTKRLTLETSDMAPGVYFCVLTADGQRITRKLIVN
jgi:hypothetical protein